MTIVAIAAEDAEASYQTERLEEYSFEYQELAEHIFNEVCKHIPGKLARRYDGSYSIFARRLGATMAKILIYEDGIGKKNGDWVDLQNGVYVLLRADWRGEDIWQRVLPLCPPEVGRSIQRDRTIGVAPKHNEPFAFFRVSDDQDIALLGEIVAACAGD